MMRLPLAAISAACAVALSAHAIAGDALSPRADQLATQQRIEADYRAARERCSALAGKAQDICLAEAKAKQRIALTEADARVKNTPRARYDARVARAEAEYQVAKERCVERAAGKEACLRDAESVEQRAKAEANAEWRAAEPKSGL